MRLPRLNSTDLGILAATLATKLAILGFGALLYPVLTGEAPRGILHGWDSWDAPHYIDLALLGYRAEDPGLEVVDGYRRAWPGDLPLYVVFYPLYPWLVGAVHAVVREPVVAAFMVSGVASLFIGPLLYRLVDREFGAEVARGSVWFLLLFPTAFVLHIGYTEALFLALALGSFWFARTDRWWLAGALGGLAALARINGLLLVPALGIEAYLAWRRDRRWRWRWLAIGLVPAGFAVYLGLNLAVYGDPLTFLDVQQGHWHKSFSPPWDGIAGVMGRVSAGAADDAFMFGWMELLFIGIGLAGTAYSALRFPPAWTVWMAGNWVLFTSTSFVLSVPRYTIVMFPLFAALAILGQRRPAVGALLIAASVVGLAYFAGRFALGQWAF